MTRFVPIAALLLLAACGRAELYSNLSERHANEMIVALNDSGIEASKRPGAEGSFVVTAPGSDFAYAMSVLDAAGFPRDEYESLGDLFRKKGLVATQIEERARYVYGLSQELSATLSVIDGVQTARVHIVMPDKDPFAEENASPSASVLLKHEVGADLGGEVGAIKALVANAVEGLGYDDVSVALFEAAPRPERQAPPVEAAAARMAAPALGAVGAAVLAAFGAALLRRKKGTDVPALDGPGEHD